MEGGGKLHFLVKMASSTNKLHIPKKFARTIEEAGSKHVKLEAPSGITRHVRIAKSEDTFVLKSGWKYFVTANEIDKNDSLLFIYEGNSSFKVLIFDPSGCERDCAVRVGDVPRHEIKTEIISLSSGSDTEFSDEASLHSARGGTTGGKVTSKRKRRDFEQEASESGEGNYRHVPKTAKKRPEERFRSYKVPQKTILTEAQEEIIDKMAQEARKGTELFAKILTKTNAAPHYILNLPSGFASEVFGNKEQKITLLPANLDRSKGSIARYRINENKRCVSWYRFVHTNRLKEGDLCLFELRKQVKRGKLVPNILVHFKANSEDVTNNSSVGFGSASHEADEAETMSQSSGSDTNSSSEISSHARVLKRKRRDCRENSTDSDEGMRKTSRPYVVPYYTHLTVSQEKIANRMSRETRKGSESFVKILTTCNTCPGGNFSLNLPTGFATEVLRDKKRKITLVSANSEKSRGISANYRKNKQARIIGSGWPELVRESGLKKGDFCLFELRKEKKQGKLVLTMVVHHDRRS